MTNKQYRQGDVFIERIEKLPQGKIRSCKDRKIILAFGEVTGHHHSISDAGCALFDAPEGVFLSVGTEGATLTHQEHAPITIPEGNYQIVIQREYSPAAIRNVQD